MSNIALTCRSLIMTGSKYTLAAHGNLPVKNATVLPNDVWILLPGRPPRVLIADLVIAIGPNSVATSPDEKTLYFDVGPRNANAPLKFATASVNLIYAYDLVNVSEGILPRPSVSLPILTTITTNQGNTLLTARATLLQQLVMMWQYSIHRGSNLKSD